MLQDIPELIRQQANFIAEQQLPSGAIPWFRNGIVTPWEHVECAIALDISYRLNEAARAYMWLRNIQNPDGSWWFSYLDGQPQDLTKDTNHSSYLAAGLWHHYLATGDMDFLSQMWPTLERCLDFVLHLQQPTGEIYWACNANGIAWQGALITASSCTWQSIKCGVEIAKILGRDRPDWDIASIKLASAINEHPELFGNTRRDEYDYAMDWYYPVLTGVSKRKEAKKRIFSRWSDFVIDNWGCKCVVESPWWVTVAETCELSLALIRIGEHNRAKLLLDWIFKLRDCDGGFWTGIKLPEEQIWPEEKPTWASAAVIMAAAAQLKYY
ncbi:MAG: prenyltransferase [Chloroflexota bacterium]|nr:prenyltransferase [Chloroflexota bacterium]